jgi:hypothetical protein
VLLTVLGAIVVGSVLANHWSFVSALRAMTRPLQIEEERTDPSQRETLEDSSFTGIAVPTALSSSPDDNVSLDLATANVTVPLSTPSPFFEYEIVARPGEELIDLSLTPSINDNGTVAFSGLTTVTLGGSFGIVPAIFIVDLSDSNPTNLTPDGAPYGTGEGLEINNQKQIIMHADFSLSQLLDGILLWWSDLQLLDANRSNPFVSLQASGSWSSDDPDQELRPWALQHVGHSPSLNNMGPVAFVAADGGTSLLNSPPTELDDITVDTHILATPAAEDFRGGYHQVVIGPRPLPLDSSDQLAPMIADDGRVVVRGGFTPVKPIEVYDYALSSPDRVADSSMEFTWLGARPAISDDGKVVVFTGERGHGPGLFLRIDEGSGFAASNVLVGVAGENATDPRPELGYGPTRVETDPATGQPRIVRTPLYFQSIDIDRRLDVVHLERGSPGFVDDSVVISFIGTPSAASLENPVVPGSPLLFSGTEGLWTIRVDFEELPQGGGLAAHPRSALPVAQIGDVLHGARIESIEVYDPLALAAQDRQGNDRTHQGRGDHRVVFGARTSIGPIIVRASYLDTDDDGLLDHWESNGIDMDGDGGIDLNLSALGANPLHKDIFLEIDWLVPRTFGWIQPWSNEPQPGVTTRLVQMFADAPVTNPDGNPGITLHIDAGPGTDRLGQPFSQNMPSGPLRQGGDLVHPQGDPRRHIDVVVPLEMPLGITGLASFQELKDLFFGTTDRRARELAFHYAILSDFSLPVPNSSGALFQSTVTNVIPTIRATTIESSQPLPRNSQGELIELVGGVVMTFGPPSAGEFRVITSQHGDHSLKVDGSWPVQIGQQFRILGLSNGVAEIGSRQDGTHFPGNDFLTALGAYGVHNGVLGNSFQQWRTLAHELGHNLGLIHCGTSPNTEDCDSITTGISIIKAGELTVSEGNLVDHYQVVLNSVPTAAVTIDILDSLGQVEAIPNQLNFSPSDWDRPDLHRVEVRAIDDDRSERQDPFANFNIGRLVHTLANSQDRAFATAAPVTLPVTVYDDETPELIVLKGRDNEVNVVEGGADDSYRILLSRQPTENVTVMLSAITVSVDPARVVFTPTDTDVLGETPWNEGQMITVSLAENSIVDPAPRIDHQVVQSGSDFRGVTLAVHPSVVDNEFKRIILEESNGSTEVTEDGEVDSYQLSLTRQPSDEVRIDFSTDGQTTVTPNPWVFTSSNWNGPVEIHVTPNDDDRVAEGLHQSRISHSVTSNDTPYEFFGVRDLHVSVRDNDTTLEQDHRSLMSYAHQVSPLSSVQSYATGQLVDEWSRLQLDFHNAFEHVGSAFFRQLGISLERYLELFGRMPDVDGPEVTVLTPQAGGEVPLAGRIRVRVLARDSANPMGSVSFLFDVDGDGLLDDAERFGAQEVAPDVFEATLPGLAGLSESRRLRVFAEDRLGNYRLEDLNLNVIPSAENDPPVALDQLVTTRGNTSVAIALQASDPNGAPLTYAVVVPPQQGILSGVPPQLVYTPNPGFFGFDGFSFQASDGLTVSNLATVTLMVGDVNRPPELAPVGAQEIDEKTSRTIAVSATDPDGDAITLSASGLPAFATFEDRGGGNGTLTLNPGAADVGVHSGIQLLAADSLFTSRENLHIVVNAVNEPPALLPIGDLTIVDFATTIFYFSASDPDGDALTLSASGLPSFATFRNGVLTLEPVRFQDPGEYPGVTVTASDGTLTASETFTITVLGDVGAPRIYRVYPPNGATYVRGLEDLHLSFTEPMEGSTVTPDAFVLTVDGGPVLLRRLEHNDNYDSWDLIFDPLPPGQYELRVDAPNVKHLAGNPLGDAPMVATRFTLVERPRVTTSLFPDRLFRGPVFAMVAHDLNGDGRLDVVAGCPNGVCVLFGNGDGTFADSTDYLGGGLVGVVDVNGDGHVDIVRARAPGDGSLLHRRSVRPW